MMAAASAELAQQHGLEVTTSQIYSRLDTLRNKCREQLSSLRESMRLYKKTGGETTDGMLTDAAKSAAEVGRCGG